MADAQHSGQGDQVLGLIDGGDNVEANEDTREGQAAEHDKCLDALHASNLHFVLCSSVLQCWRIEVVLS